ncbi:SPOR domain-containing protein [Mucilaginibacter segetis]|uniref:SPOR domain-containing protein n=1 Tax=Mucilaginibacter segetis TaxID=2793071 RepID=A0A934PUV7_9SPHI|nr:SPOR domain-containing protein [Mucilaginibacter segetis]MBK0381273.1 SPOR domain-containing protein [Mucilaginibacter segetis]
MNDTVLDYKAINSKVSKYCIFFLLIFLSVKVSAQERGKVTVIRDPLFDTLLVNRADLNTDIGTRSYSSYGYRIQIYNGSNRSAAYSAQAKFNELYPEMRTYISYREPNFKVRAGDFRTRLEAEKTVQELKPLFSPMFIISDKINPPKTVVNND